MAIAAPYPHAPLQGPAGSGRDLRFLLLGGALALAAHVGLQWLGHMPWWQRASRRFIWWHEEAPPHGPYGSYAGARALGRAGIGDCVPDLACMGWASDRHLHSMLSALALHDLP